jgi:F420-non-reducing hydrogenase large subunit
MSTRVTINPITRLEGHGKIEIFLNDAGDVERAFFQVPEVRGFETFCIGRASEEMPRITERICGVCPTAHHMASTKCLDDLWKVEPTRAAWLVRRLVYNAFTFEDHNLHFFYLGGPDFIVGPTAPAAERNILGVIAKVGLEIAGKLIKIRRETRNIIQTIGGKVVHPVFGLPGGVSRGIDEEERRQFLEVARESVGFAEFALQAFADIVLANKDYVDLILSEGYTHKTYYMGLVDENKKVDFYERRLRVVDPEGKEVALFEPHEYTEYIAEHVEPWSYITFPFLKKVGWKGFVDGPDSGVYRVAPLARLNASEGMRTPKAQEHYEKFYETLGGKPAHNTLAFHWARLVEALQAAEEMEKILEDDEVTSDDIRNLPTETPSEGVGIVEAPRGTLIHHYFSDPDGVLTKVNLIVATNHNSAPMAMSVEKAAKAVIKGGKVDDGLLNMVEMAFRPYDPCHACATHAIGHSPLVANIYGPDGELLQTVRRDG